MKKILWLASLAALSIAFAVPARAEKDCSKDYLYDRQQSLVVYHYTDSSGKKIDKTFGKWADVPAELKAMCWECWVDSLGWYNCKEVNSKKGEGKAPESPPSAAK